MCSWRIESPSIVSIEVIVLFKTHLPLSNPHENEKVRSATIGQMTSSSGAPDLRLRMCYGDLVISPSGCCRNHYRQSILAGLQQTLDKVSGGSLGHLAPSLASGTHIRDESCSSSGKWMNGSMALRPRSSSVFFLVAF